jgi:hypothetical protein
MSDDEKRKKPKYEAPTIVALGGLAQGTGQCTSGAGVSGYCQSGSNPSGVDSYCKDGSSATGYCSIGNFATGSYCTTGNSGGACNNGASA